MSLVQNNTVPNNSQADRNNYLSMNIKEILTETEGQYHFVTTKKWEDKWSHKN